MKEKKSKKGLIILIAVIVVVAIAIGAGSAGGPKKVNSDGSTAQSSAQGSQAAKDEKFTIGDTADFDGIKVTLSKAILSAGDGQFVKPENGKKYLCLVFDIANDSKNDITVSSMASFEAYCDEYTLNQSLMGQQCKEVKGINQLDGSVAAGKKMNGVIAYEVPEDFKTFDIKFSPSFLGSKSVTYSFTAENLK